LAIIDDVVEEAEDLYEDPPLEEPLEELLDDPPEEPLDDPPVETPVPPHDTGNGVVEVSTFEARFPVGATMP
jgi:hypothetical protein